MGTMINILIQNDGKSNQQPDPLEIWRGYQTMRYNLPFLLKQIIHYVPFSIHEITHSIIHINLNATSTTTVKMRHTFKTRRFQFDQDIYIRSRGYGWLEIHIGYSTNKRWKYTYNDIFIAFMGRVAIPLYGLTSSCYCACPKSGSGFRTRDVGAIHFG